MHIDKEALATLAWDTYSAAVGGKAFNGAPLPTWEAMCADPSKARIVSAWRKVAVRLAATTLHSLNTLMLSLTDFKDEVAELMDAAIAARLLRDRETTVVEAAYWRVRSRLDDLTAQGVAVSIYPSKQRNDAELAAKYAPPLRLRPSLWVNVEIEAVDEAQQKLVFDFRDELLAEGIVFDTGGGLGSLDWSFDWSFHLKP